MRAKKLSTQRVRLQVFDHSKRAEGKRRWHTLARLSADLVIYGSDANPNTLAAKANAFVTGGYGATVEPAS